MYSKNKRRERINYFVERTLLSRYRQELSLKKFELTMHIDESYCALVNRWIEYAIESNVKELNLSSVCQPKFSQVPKSVLVAKSITKLTLCFCNLKSLHNDINLSSLKKLVVGQVRMDDQNFKI
jgi:hypothetical protein